MTATRRKSTRLSFFIVPFSEQVKWGPVVVICVKIEGVRRSLYVAESHVEDGDLPRVKIPHVWKDLIVMLVALKCGISVD